MLVVSHESVSVVAFSLWAAFELYLEHHLSFIEIQMVLYSRKFLDANCHL